VRFWGCSRSLTKAMNADYEPKPVMWFRTNIRRFDEKKNRLTWFPVWVSPDLYDDDNNTTLNKFDEWLPTWFKALTDLGKEFD
ncbi:MAG: hypothetical protein Q7I94_00635, partial [Candidatus Contubernalis sp.]|nr:hypothetical protein [Candidatus Contubernalis sp.]